MILISSILYSQKNYKLPFVGMKSFSFCGGNACESEITISKNGKVKIITYGFMREESFIEYNGLYKPIIWIKDQGKITHGYKIINGNTIYQVDLKGKYKKDCFEGTICKSFLYYTDQNGNVKY